MKKHLHKYKSEKIKSCSVNKCNQIKFSKSKYGLVLQNFKIDLEEIAKYWFTANTFYSSVNIDWSIPDDWKQFISDSILWKNLWVRYDFFCSTTILNALLSFINVLAVFLLFYRFISKWFFFFLRIHFFHFFIPKVQGSLYFSESVKKWLWTCNNNLTSSEVACQHGT
jgi:hypothetical protein